MASTIKTFTTTGSWLCPPGVTATKVEIRAPGGGSGGMTTDTFAVGGAAGGQYVRTNAFTVTPGTSYTVTIGAVGAAGSATGPTNGTAGGDTWFSTNDANGVVAKGGNPSLANSRTGGLGSTTGYVGDVVWAGGNGADSTTTNGGGGGEGGCSDKAGGNGAVTAGGSGGDGGDGGTGATNGVGGAATAYGGGGGGSAATGTTNRAGRAGAAGSVVLTYTTPAMSSLTDNFDDDSINTAKWAANAWAGTVAESGSKIVLTPTNNTAYAGCELDSNERYDLTGTSAYVKVSQVANGLNDTEFILYQDANNKLNLFQEDGTIYARKVVSGTSTNTASTAYNATTMAWWQIRESGGVTYWEYGSNGTSWTELWHENNPITVTLLQVILSDYETAAVNPAGAAWFDNFNVVPAAALSGTVTSSITEADIVTGGKTIILTVTDDTWVATGATFDGQRQNIINGVDSAQSEATGWDAEVKAKEVVGAVVRTSDTVSTITLTAEAGYDITATETITATVPASALTGGNALVAAPTFTITATAAASTAKLLGLLGVG
jgi:hypothetical protein